MQRRHQLMVFELHQHLRYPGNARNALSMPDVGFYRADGAEMLIICVFPEGFSHARDFTRIHANRACTVHFHITHCPGIHPGPPQCLGDQLKPGLLIATSIAICLTAGIKHAALDNSKNMITVRDCPIQRF